jgi:hypothetical protein
VNVDNHFYSQVTKSLFQMHINSWVGEILRENLCLQSFGMMLRIITNNLYYCLSNDVVCLRFGLIGKAIIKASSFRLMRRAWDHHMRAMMSAEEGVCYIMLNLPSVHTRRYSYGASSVGSFLEKSYYAAHVS